MKNKKLLLGTGLVALGLFAFYMYDKNKKAKVAAPIVLGENEVIVKDTQGNTKILKKDTTASDIASLVSDIKGSKANTIEAQLKR